MTARSVVPDSVKIRLRRALARLGIEIGAYAGSFADHRAQLIVEGGVATVWDVGAHVGQYGARLRDLGYQRRLISIEPSQRAFEQLSERARRDNGRARRHGEWTVLPTAVSDSVKDDTLFLSANGQSSSLLPMSKRHVLASPDSTYVGEQRVQTTTLDLLRERLAPPAPFYIKLDLQGAEMAALRGASRALRDTTACEVELSFRELYDGGATWEEVSGHLGAHGFAICDIERVFYDPASKDLLQVNALYRR